MVRIMHKFRLPIAIAIACGCALALVSVAGAATSPFAYTTKGAWSFASAPKLHPPKVRTIGSAQTSKIAPGYFVTTNFKDLALTRPMVGQGGPLILDRNLQPVWFLPVTNAWAGNLRVQTYNGKPALTWWEGQITPTGVTTSGKDVVVNQHYQTVATLTGQDGWIISEHEMIISGDNAWVTAYKNVPMDLTPYGGSGSGVVLDSAVQEYNLKTGALIYTWDALNPGGTPNVPLSQSQTRPAPNGFPWDAYHINSIQLTGHETFLVSLRNTWSAYMVNRATNAIEWTLSGNPKLSSFKLAADAQFHWQHDVELHNGNLISVFDDACCAITGVNSQGVAQFGPKSGATRGLVLKLDTTAHTGDLVSQYVRTTNTNLDSAFLGDIDLLSDGNVAVGWGSQPFFSEFGKSGRQLVYAQWPIPDISYRVYVQNWVGTPYFPPSGAVRTSHGRDTVYASWDGATQVASWRVLGGSDAKHLKLVATKAKSGFETAIALGSTYKTYEVQALDATGHVLRTSNSFSASKQNSTSNSGLPQAY